MALKAGVRVGTYEVLSMIGAGGMGEVYRARDTRLGRDVALKLLPELFALDSERLARFEREARTLAALNHPHIAQIYGVEETDDVLALVMELVEGEDLAMRLSRGAIPLDEALAIASQIAEALEAAHDAGIIHRDLKPANVKLRPDGTVKVLDFGLAKALDAPPGSDAGALMNSPTITSPALMTARGVILGTAAYMAPEQARGKAIDKRADIWAFGCVLYEMLAGRRPFVGEDVSDTLAAVLKSDPEWLALPPETPASLRRLLRRCLARDPRQRLADIRDARIEIGEVLNGGAADEARAVPAGGTKRKRWVWAVAVVTLLAAAAAAFAAGVLRVGREPRQPLVRATIEMPSKLQRIIAPVVSPDGRWVVFDAFSDTSWMLWLRALDSPTAQPLPGTEGGVLPFWSPDGRSIAFFADGKLKKIDILGGPAVTIADAPVPRGGAWSSRGVIVFAATAAGGLLQVNAAGGASAPATTPDLASTTHRWPHFLPDDRHFLFTGSSPGGVSAVFLGDLQDPKSSKVVAQAGSHAVYVPGGTLLFMRGTTLFRQPFDTERLQTTGEPTPIVENVAVGESGMGLKGSFSASESVLVYAAARGEQPRNLVWVDRRGMVTPIPLAPGALDSPSLSPDGRQVALTIRDQSGTHIWVYDLDRGTLGKRSFEDVNEFPIWTQDGLYLAFSRGQDRGRILRVRSDGTGQAEEVAGKDGGGPKVPTSWSADSRVLALQHRQDIVVREPDGTLHPVLGSPALEREARFAPSGPWFAYRSNETGRDEVYVQSYPVGNGKWQISTDGGAQPMWSRDGRELFYKSGNRLMVVAVETGATFRAGPPRVLVEMPLPESVAGDPSRFGVSADGKRFLVLTSTPGDAPATQPPTHLLLNWSAHAGRTMP